MLYRYNYENNKEEIKELAHNLKGVTVGFEFSEEKINNDLNYIQRTYLWNKEEDEEDFF